MLFKLLGIGIIFSLGLILSSCTKEESLNSPEANSTENLQLKVASNPAHTEDVFCDLIAGQTIPAGQVIITHDDDYIYVEYLTSGGWGLSEVHLYIGTADGVPRNKTAIQIGHFPYSATNLNGVTQYKIPVPRSALPTEPTGGYAVFAHAVVMNGDRQETAWSNGCAYKPLITVKSWFNNSINSGNSWWAASSGVPFSESSYWCSLLGTNIYSGKDTYDFQSERLTMINPGRIEVYDNGSKLFVDVYANTDDGYTLARTFVYVGNMSGLESIPKESDNLTCPDYAGHFPDRNLVEGNVHSFDFPLALVSSVSFKEEFESNRWGWFFYYSLN